MHKTFSDHKALWTTKEFAHAHGVSVRHIYRLLRQGALQALHVGRRVLVTEESRRSWLSTLPKTSASTRSLQSANTEVRRG